MTFVSTLLIVFILGGMMAFQLLFAPLIFIKLEMSVARGFIRAFFPFYYLYFGVLSLAALVVALVRQEYLESLVLGASFAGFVVSRQLLMPLANKATDGGNKMQFDRYHRLTVLINTLQILAIGYLIYLW